MFRRLTVASPGLMTWLLMTCLLLAALPVPPARAMDFTAMDSKATDSKATDSKTADFRITDINSFRASHKRPPLRLHAGLAAAAEAHARDLASRNQLDHRGFRQRLGAVSSGAAAENVSYGCENEACAILQWSRSSGHRANMLRRDVTRYGLASARAETGRRYWVLELGN